MSIDHLPVPSPFTCALGIPKRRVHAVRFPMDELFAYARDKRTKHYPHVGYLPGQGLDSNCWIVAWTDGTVRPRGQMHFPSSICTCALRSSSNGAQNYDRWIFRQVDVSINTIHGTEGWARASSCFFSLHLHRTGVTMRSSYSSVRPLCSVQFGTMHRVISTPDSPSE